MPTIRDVVRPNPDAEFASDVQLSWYPNDKRNDPLASGYIFTAKSIENFQPSVEVLDTLQKAFTWEGNPNRYVVMATYGHGKTHLALALANYFGKPSDSNVVKVILGNISHAVDQPAKAQGFKDFKDSHKPYLVVRLFGDQMKSLHQQAIAGVEAALKEHEETKNASLPFWFGKAEQFLSRLSGKQLEEANEFLRSANTEVSILLERVKDSDATHHELIRQLFGHLHYGTLPDFGGDVSLKDVVEWVAGEFCGEDKPFPGMLILFDEFSAFIRQYASGAPVNRGSSLQSLLLGVENCRSKAVFVAFSQHDPDNVANSAFTASRTKEDREDLSHELTRLPAQQRYNLYSSMENVLDSYLKQDDSAWDALLDEDTMLDLVVDATNATMQLFPVRYDLRMGWGDERVREVMTKGCFPLHPVTTGMLCSVQLREVSEPRSVLGFVLDELEHMSDQPATRDGKPNWIYATKLVDEFGEMLADSEYSDYRSAAQRVGPDAPDVQKAVLKAMLLHMVAQLPRRMNFDRVIAELTGFSPQDCAQALEDLYSGGYIRKDDLQKIYVFYSGGADGAMADKWIKSEAGRLRLDRNGILEINKEWRTIPTRLKPMPVSWSYGQEEDWAASQILLTRDTFTEDVIKSVALNTQMGTTGIDDAARGYLIWLLADTDQDVDYFRTNAAGILDAALGSDPPPVVVAIPTIPSPFLRQSILSEKVVQTTDAGKKRELGDTPFEDAKKRIAKAVNDGLESLKSNAKFVVPQPYRAAVQIGGEQISLQVVLKQCYTVAYSYVPPFFTHYKGNATQLRKGVSVVSKLLAKNQVQDIDGIRGLSPVADEILEKYLRVGASDSWGLVSLNNQIQAPTSSRITAGWKLLEDAFKPESGETLVTDVFLALLNPPYGYDYNRLLILFCAWYGVNRHNLQLILGTKSGSIDDIANQLDKPAELIAHLTFVDRARISRRDPSSVSREIQQLIKQADSGQFTCEQAEMAQSKLIQFTNDESNDAVLRSAAESTQKRICDALAKAAQYDKDARHILNRLKDASVVKIVGNCWASITELKSTGCVSTVEPSPSELQDIARKQMTYAVMRRCSEHEKLKDITEYELHKTQLMSIKTELTVAGMTELHCHVDAALKKLEEFRQRQVAKIEDSAVIAEVQAMRAEARLAELRKNLERLGKITCQSDDARQLIDQATEHAKGAISNAEQFVTQLESRLTSIRSVAEARQLELDANGRLERYAGTNEDHKLSEVLHQAGQLQPFFASLDRAKNAELDAPVEVEKCLADLNALASEYGRVLSPEQEKLIAEARDLVEKAKAEKERKAEAWLEGIENRAQNQTDPTRLIEELSHPPAFLSDGKRRMLTLRSQLQTKVEEDEVTHIKQLFNKIQDRDRRVRLIEELNALVRELDAK